MLTFHFCFLGHFGRGSVHGHHTRPLWYGASKTAQKDGPLGEPFGSTAISKSCFFQWWTPLTLGRAVKDCYAIRDQTSGKYNANNSIKRKKINVAVINGVYCISCKVVKVPKLTKISLINGIKSWKLPLQHYDSRKEIIIKYE